MVLRDGDGQRLQVLTHREEHAVSGEGPGRAGSIVHLLSGETGRAERREDGTLELADGDGPLVWMPDG